MSNPYFMRSDVSPDPDAPDRLGRSLYHKLIEREGGRRRFDFEANPEIGDPPVPDEVVVDLPEEQNISQSPGKVDKKKPQKKVDYSFNTAGKHEYFLELFDDPKAKEPIATVKLPFVFSLEMTQPNAVARSWVLSGDVYEEHSGFQQRTFRLRGRSGYSPNALSKFAIFRNFMEKYASLSRENKNAFFRAKDIRLAINFPWEGEAFWATLLNFSYSREIGTTRISYGYEITLVTNGVSAARWDEKNGLSYITCGENGDSCHIDPRHYCARRAQEEPVTSPPEVGDKMKPPPSFKRLCNVVRMPREQILASPQTCQRIFSLCVDVQVNIMASLDAVVGPIKTRARQFAATILRWVVDLRMQMEQVLGSQLLQVPRLADIRIGIDLNASAVLNAELRPKPVPAVADRGRPVAVATVKDENTTLIDLAGRLLGDRNRWVVLAELNNMQDARTFIDGRPLQPGDKIIVPAPEGVLNADPESTYGTNLRIVDGDLVSVGDVDVALISGLENYYQCFSHRMRTIRGANRTYPDFGLPPIVGTVPDTPDAPAQLLSAVRRQTLSDHRVASVSELTLKENLDKYEISLAITTAIDEKTTAAFTYEV